MAARITQSEIAQNLGLSPIAVSYALRGSNKVSSATRKRVLDTAQKMGYRINNGARAIRTGRHGSFALLLSRQRHVSTLPAELLNGIDNELSQIKNKLLVCRLPNERLTGEGNIPQLLQENAADGLLINYTYRIPKKMMQIIQRDNLPAVWINAKFDRNAVYPDDLDAGHQATTKLLEAGHRRIAYADYSHPVTDLDDTHYSAVDRQAGYEQTMVEAGLQPRVIRPSGRVNLFRINEDIRQQLDTADRPTAMITYSPTISVHIVLAASALGLSCPDDLSVMTFRDQPTAHEGFPVAAMLTPNYEVGSEAVRMLHRRVEAPRERYDSVAVRHEYDPGQGIAPPPTDR